MSERLDWMKFPCSNYTFEENDQYGVWISGILGDCRSRDIFEIASAAFSETLDYNDLSGFYRIVFFDKINNAYLFFGDANGSQKFFFNRDKGIFSDSFLFLRALMGENVKPDWEGLWQIFSWEICLAEKTYIQDISATSHLKSYLLKDGVIRDIDKCIHSLTETKPLSLSQTVKEELALIGNRGIGAVCTGGTDSRAVLANLVSNHRKVPLILTGHPDNPDVAVAKKVADTVQMPLTIISPQTKSDHWLESGIYFLDGFYDAVLSYRHLQKGLWALKNQVAYEFGGLGGEFYKNSFCRPFVFIKNKGKCPTQFVFPQKMSDVSWWGEKIQAASCWNDMVKPVVEIADHECSPLLKSNRMGVEKLTHSSGSITHGYSRICCKVDPLLDYRVIASLKQTNPIKLSMMSWQRNEIHRAFPDLSDIPTDQGFTCGYSFTKRMKDASKKFVRNCMRFIDRFILPGKPKIKAPDYWKKDYLEARKTPEWKKAFTYCQENGIISHTAAENTIPLAMTGWILLVGMVLTPDFYNWYNTENDDFALN